MKYRHLITLISISLITACGGGGGSGNSGPAPVTYSGKTSAVAISDDNANTMSRGVLSLSASEGLDLFGVETSTPPPLTTITFNIVEHMRAVDTQVLNQSLPGIAINETEACSFGGTINISVELNETTSEFSGTFTYDNCNESGDSLNGTANVGGQLDVFGELTGPFSLSTSRLTYKDGLGAESSLAGSIDCTFGSYPNPSGEIVVDDSGAYCIENLVVVDSAGGNSYKLEDFEIIQIYYPDIAPDFYITVYNGRFFQSDFGYVDIDSILESHGFSVLYYIEGYEFPLGGELVLRGLDDSTSQMLPDSSTSTYTLNIDADGDGSFETTTTEVW